MKVKHVELTIDNLDNIVLTLAYTIDAVKHAIEYKDNDKAISNLKHAMDYLDKITFED